MLSLRRHKTDPYAELLDPESEFWKRYRAAILPVVLQFAIPIVLAGAKAGHRVRVTKAAPKLAPIQLPVGTHLTNALLKRIMRDTVLEYSSDLTDKLYGATYDAVKAAVSDAAAHGKPVSAVIRDLKPLFGPERAKTVAVTETTRLMGAGSQAIYRAQDVPYWEWMTVNDDLVCPICEDLDSTQFSQAEDFEPAHVNCRCFPAPAEEDAGSLDLRAAEWVIGLRFDPDQPRDDAGRWTDSETGGRVAATALDMLAHGEGVKIRPEHLGDLLAAVTKGGVEANLSKLQVEGYPNLFDRHLTETERANMPQLPRTNTELQDFSKYLGEIGLRGTLEQVDPTTLIATQNEMNTLKVAEIYNAFVERGGAFKADKGTLIVSKEGGVLDGHHRWAAAASYSITHQPTPVNILRVDAPIDVLMKAAREYPGADVARSFHTRPDPATKPFGDKPTSPPPDGGGWLWFDGQWIQIVTDGPEKQKLFDPDQPRDEAGRWTDIGTTGALSDRMQANAAKWAAEHGITPERLSSNLKAMFGGANADQLARGMSWYADAHNIATGNADKFGGSVEQQAGLLAALSPQVDWGVNVRGAEVINQALASDTFTLTQEDADARLASIERTSAQHLREGSDPEREAARLASERSFLQSHVGTVPTASVSSADLAHLLPLGGVLYDSAQKGVDIMRGASPDDVLGGFKVRSFYNNIAAPTASTSVTIDSHMIRGMLGDVNTDPAVLASVFQNPARYDMFAGAVRTSAAEQGVLPNQAQAVDWTVWREAHP